MIGILYPLKMTKNLSEAYSAIYEISADLAIKAAKGAEKKRAESAKAGDTEGAKKAMGQNKKFFDYAKGKRQKENMPKKPTGPMANKPSPDPTSSYPGTPQVMKQGKIVKSSYEPEGEIVEGDTKAMKKYLDDKAKKLTKKRDAQSDAYKNNPAFDSTSPNPKYEEVGKFRQEWEALKLIETENYREQFDTWLDGIVEEGYDIERWSDEELVDTFINENNLWASREAVDSALLESDKKGKGSGKKDACYKKVKASASVWPRAYASGRLVQCRKKGAANYGNSSKKEEVEYEEVEYIAEIPGSGIVAKEVGKQVLKRGVKRAAKRAAIKIGKKTGGKVVQAATKQGGKELKKQVVAASGEIAANAVKKTGEKLRKKAAPDTNKVGVKEAVAPPPKKKAGTAEKVGGIVGSIGGGIGGGAAGAGVASIGTGIAGSIAGEHVGKKIGRAIDKKMKPKTKINSSFSDWRGELNLDENRATAYTAGMSDGQKAAEMRKISPKVADEAGRSHDKFMFGNRKKSGKTNKKYNKEVLKDKKYNQNTTGRGMPVSYRDSYEKDRDDVIQSKIRQGKGSIKDLGKKK